MEFTRSRYPDYPGAAGDPCWTLSGKWTWIDVDWNPRFPYGGCFGAYFGRKRGAHQYLRGGGFTVDLNAPLGEPNRLYLNTRRWHVILGLPTIRREEFYEKDGEKRSRTVRCFPRLTSTSRYRYHQTDNGHWVRNDEPEPMHWGWLTVERT